MALPYRSFRKKGVALPHHSLIALLSLFFCNFFKDFFLTSILELVIYKKFYVKLKVPLLPRIYKPQDRSDGQTSLFIEKECQKTENFSKKRVKKRAAHIFALLKNMSATPTSLLLIKRSGTPPSLPILGVALRSGAQKSGTL